MKIDSVFSSVINLVYLRSCHSGVVITLLDKAFRLFRKVYIFLLEHFLIYIFQPVL